MNKDAVAEMGQQYQVEAAQKLVSEGYKQTEAGVIPEDWSTKKVGEVADVIRGASPRPKGDKRYYGGSVPRLMVEDVTRDGKYVTPSVDSLTEEGAKLSRPCSKGTLTLVCSGTVGVPSILAVDACIHDGFLGLVRVSKKTSIDYLYHFFTTQQEKFNNSATHGGVFTNLTTDGVKEFLIAFPSTYKEQQVIAKTLSDTDALLSELEKLIAKKQAIKTATMQQLLTGHTRLPQFAHHPDGSKKGYKQSELGEIPEDWEVIQLGEITTFLKGAGLPKSDLIDSGKNRCIHYGQLFTSYGPKIEKIFSSTDIDGSIKSETNDVLMPTSDVTPNGLATASCILESGIVLGGDILIIRSKKELLDGVFFAYLITVMRDQIMQLVTGSTVYHLYGSDMARFFFARPSIDEQTAIATILADMDEEIQALEQRLNKTRQIKQGMMQELLTGRTRLL